MGPLKNANLEQIKLAKELNKNSENYLTIRKQLSNSGLGVIGRINDEEPNKALNQDVCCAHAY